MKPSSTNLQARVNDSAYYPSKEMLSEIKAPITKRAIRPGFLPRSDRFDVDRRCVTWRSTRNRRASSLVY